MREMAQGVRKMIFLRYESFKEYTRYYQVTSLLMLLNVLYFIFISFNGGSTNLLTLIKYGALFNHPDFTNEYWRYFTSMFIHIGFAHLLFNCFALFLFSPPLEKMLGKIKFLILYIGSGLIGSLISMQLIGDLAVSAGASGAIYGIFGALVFISLYRRHLIDDQSRKTLYIILVIGIIHSLISPAINYFAHFGGFIGGVLWFWLLEQKK